jgi:signal transduction histidine kinase
MEWEELVPQADGEHTYISLKVPLFDSSGVPYAVCGISTDITERKLAEDTLREAVRMRDEFLQVASHELRTPMTTLMLALESLRNYAAGRDSVTERHVGLALRGGKRMKELVEGLLAVSSFNVGELALTPVDVDLAGVVEEVLRRFQPALVKAHCVVSTRLEHVVCRGDRARLDEVVSHLVSNAIKFGAGAPIDVTVQRDGDIARFVIRDHGIGIAPALQPRIFERFARGVSVAHYGGLGLGLYVSKEIVQAQGGTIRVESAEGQGACFTVELPLGGGVAAL